MRIAVIGSTGTVGSHVAGKLKTQGAEMVEVSRATGVDLIRGEGLRTALSGVDVAIDASNPYPSDESIGLQDALTTATLNVLDACAAERVGLVFVSIIGVEDPGFDDFPYYVAKRAQEELVQQSPVPSTVVKAAQFHEFATNPAAVSVQGDDVSVQDWLIQPIAAESVAEVLIETATARQRPQTLAIAGPEPIRLPELTARLLQVYGDTRRVRTVPAQLDAFAQGLLLAPEHAYLVGLSIGEWLPTSSARSTWQRIARDQ